MVLKVLSSISVMLLAVYTVTGDENKDTEPVAIQKMLETSLRDIPVNTRFTGKNKPPSENTTLVYSGGPWKKFVSDCRNSSDPAKQLDGIYFMLRELDFYGLDGNAQKKLKYEMAEILNPHPEVMLTSARFPQKDPPGFFAKRYLIIVVGLFEWTRSGFRAIVFMCSSPRHSIVFRILSST
jgi:hypothetical protein